MLANTTIFYFKQNKVHEKLTVQNVWIFNKVNCLEYDWWFVVKSKHINPVLKACLSVGCKKNSQLITCNNAVMSASCEWSPESGWN